MAEVETTSGGLDVVIATTTDDDHAEIHGLFRAVVATGEGYPQAPDDPVPFAAFHAYWLAPAATGLVARVGATLAGACTIKPNGVGRAAHVANAGYVVDRRYRGRGLGTLLVERSFDAARARGFDAMQFNFVFASNPARRLYERLGFQDVGQIPDVIDGEAVHIYWRKL